MSIPLLLFALLSMPAAHANAVHSWTDAQGLTHYSDRPPPGYDSQRHWLRPAPSPGPSLARPLNRAERAAAEQRRFEAILRRDAIREEKARQQRCHQLDLQLELLNNQPRLVQLTNGARHPLSEADRQRLISETRERWRISCRH